MGKDLYLAFKEYEVEAEDVADFLEKYTKHEKHRGRGQDYAESRIRSYTKEFKEKGYVFMSRHESITGKVVSYYGKKPSKDF